ncbi:serine hydrolase domain-containing protein [Anditalea andensis]|nr:serine hydrolase [Anditalea andensis]
MKKLLKATIINIGTYILIFILILCKTTDSKSQHIDSKNSSEFSLNFEKKIKSIYTENEMQGDFIFAVVNEKGLVYSYALNNEILKGNITSLDNHSPIYIASHTKSFTGTLIKILEEKGQIDLDKSLTGYLPDLHFHSKIDTDKIKIKNLLNHTHGIFSSSLTWKTAYLGYSGNNSELIEDFNKDYFYDPSGSFRYSNVGPIIAGIIIEKETGNSWKDEMNKHIFKPLKMFNTTTKVSEVDYKSIRHSNTFSKVGGIVETGFYKQDITMHASGGIISTINDLSKWLSANIRKDTRLLTKNSWEALHQSSTTQDKEYFTYKRKGYSLGWDVAEYQGETILTRFGGLAGISFHISFIPENKIGIIAFSTDNRAYLLPHLMANYAYNKFASNDAERTFTIEKDNFQKAFDDENNISHPNESQLMTINRSHDGILGVYRSTIGWPSISIIQKENNYIFNWGELGGKIYKADNGGYISNLGVMTREFNISNDTLMTGSQIYLKEY